MNIKTRFSVGDNVYVIDWEGQRETCSICTNGRVSAKARINGKSVKVTAECPRCGGNGELRVPEVIRVRVEKINIRVLAEDLVMMYTVRAYAPDGGQLAGSMPRKANESELYYSKVSAWAAVKRAKLKRTKEEEEND